MSDEKPLDKIPGKAPDPIELGNSGWNILHSAAAVYPYHPTPEQREAMKGFIHGWSYVYACNWCAYHMRRYVAEHPPVVSDKISVSRYICEFHNTVNEHLGKDQFSCDPDVLLRRWHPGYPDKMGDHPSMEELVAREQEKMKQEKKRAPAATNTRPESNGSENPSSGWRSWQNTKEETTTNHSSNTANPEKQTSGGSGWFGFGKGKKETVTLEQTKTVSSTKVADDETDVDAVLARLKKCQVYCPDNEDKF